MLEVVVIPFDGAVQVRLSSIVGHSSFRDAPLGAGPESRTTDRGYGFRARSLRSRPGMTALYVSTNPVLEPLAAESLAPWGSARYDSELISISRDDVRLNSLAS
jgi:hypothetical protein